MAYFEPYVDADGIHVPTYSEIMEHFTERYKEIFGDDVYISEETPDYQILSVFAKCVNDFATLATEAYYARSPYYASGNSLDVLVRLGGLFRQQATHSTAVLTVSGTEGAVIPIQSKAIDQNGNLWEIESEYTIPEAGYGTVSATCTTAGAIVALAGTINRIYTPTPGWTDVTNSEDASTGSDTESDSKLRERFLNTHSRSNSGTYDSIVTGLYDVDGVTFATVKQNDTGSTVGGIPAHSICAIVEGGDADEVAKTILLKKAPGVGTYGDVEKTVVDDYGNDNTVKFTRPTQLSTSVTINVTKIVGKYDADRIEPIIKEAIKNDINNLGIGTPWSVTMGYMDIYSQFDSKDIAFTITSISATNTHGTSTSLLQCDYNEILQTSEANITINAT